MQVDKELWIRISQDDQEAYASVYRFYFRRFYNYGRKFTDDEPLLEDAVKEVLLTIWDKRSALSSIEFAGTYFYTTFRYILFHKLKQKKQGLSSELSIAEPEFSIDHFIMARETGQEMKEKLERSLATLTARQREAIFLRFYEGLSYEEVASVLQITTKATYKIMARALAELREHLALVVFFGILYRNLDW